MKRLTELLTEKKSAILDAWLDVVLKSYPPDSAQFLKHRERRFSNPVGYTISEGLEAVLDGLIRKENPQDISLLLELGSYGSGPCKTSSRHRHLPLCII